MTQYFSLLIPILGLAINVSCQLISLKLLLKGKLLKSVFLGFLAGLLTIIILCSTIKHDFLGILLANLLTYTCLGYCYFHFINLGETARRIRLMRELLDGGNNGLTQDEILKRYNAKIIVEVRLKRLLNNQQINCCENKYFIGNPAMLFMASVIIFMKRLLLGRESEDETS